MYDFEDVIGGSKIDSLIADLYAEVVNYQKEMEPYNYDEQTRRSNHKELRVLDAKIDVTKSVIKRLQALREE